MLYKLFITTLLIPTIIYPSAAQRKTFVKPAPKATAEVVWVAVARQSNADCGYHALYNAATKYVDINSTPKMPDEVLELLRSAVVSRRVDIYIKELDRGKKPEEPSDAGSWLDDGEIEFLIEKHLDTIVDTKNVRLTQQHLVIIPDILTFNPISKDLTTQITALRNNPGTVYSFILGNMDQATPDVGGHWIAVTVHNKDGVLKYYAMNSLSSRPTNYIVALKKLLEESSTELRELMVSQEIDNARREITSKNYKEALTRLEEFINQTQEKNLLEAPELGEKIEEMSALLTAIKDSKTDYAGYAQMLLDKLPDVVVTTPAATTAAAATSTQSGAKKKKKKGK